jgi:hypothetical protein
MIEVLKQALEALEDLGMKHHENTGEVLYKETYDHLRQAIAELEKQEPVAWITQGGKGWLRFHKSYDDNKGNIPVYTSPQPRKPLTLEHLRLYWKHAKVFDELHVEVDFPDYLLLVRDTEAQHGIGDKS